MICEITDLMRNKMGYYSHFHMKSMAGPWQVKHPVYAAMSLPYFRLSEGGWPEEVSHGKMIGTKFNHCME